MSQRRHGTRAMKVSQRKAARVALLKKYGPYCQICIRANKTEYQATILFNVDPNHNYAWSLDHIIPVSEGGKNEIDNFEPAHRICNKRRGSEPIRKAQEVRVPSRAPRLAYSSSSYAF